MEQLAGRAIVSIEGLYLRSDRVKICLSDGTFLVLKHFTECCEDVDVESVEGDQDALTGAVVLSCEKTVTGLDTKYLLTTTKGSLSILFKGSLYDFCGAGVSANVRDIFCK